MILASITIGSILFLILTTILYVQILHALKHKGVIVKTISFVVGSMIFIKSVMPNILLVFQLWSASKFTDSPNLSLAKGVALQFGMIILFQLGMTVVSSLAGYIIPTKDDDNWTISSKTLIIGVFMIATAYIGGDLLFNFGKELIGTNEVGFH